MSKRKELLESAVIRGKYAKLYEFLKQQPGSEISLTFSELERILGFELPDSAFLYRPWWANQDKSGHSQAMAWAAAGWKTSQVDLEAERLLFLRDDRASLT